MITLKHSPSTLDHATCHHPPCFVSVISPLCAICGSSLMRHPRIRRRGIQARLVRLAGGDGLLHLVIDLQDDALGAVFAVLLLVLAVGVAGNGAE